MSFQNARDRLSEPIRFSATLEGKLFLGPWELFTETEDRAWRILQDMRNLSVPHLVVTPNVDQVLNLATDEAFRACFDCASLRLVDGAPIALLGSLLLRRRVHRNTGADALSWVSLRATPDAPLVIALVGGDPLVSSEAAIALHAGNRFAHITSIPTPFGEPSDSVFRPVVDELKRVSPDFVFLGFGSPKQEKWFKYWSSELPPAIYFGSGAAYAFAGNSLRRAPQWVQRIGMEWFYRLLQEPKRLFHRYIIKGPRFGLVFVSSIFHSLGRVPA